MTVNIKEQGVAMSLMQDQLQSFVLLFAGTPAHATPLAAIQWLATLTDPSTVTLTGPSVTRTDVTPADLRSVTLADL